MATKFETQEYVIFVQSTKIGTQENKGIHSIWTFHTHKISWIFFWIIYLKAMWLSKKKKI